MAADEGLKATDHALERLVFFSDAVFAIAITLLVIEIHPPHLPHGAGDAAHLRALAALMPNFVGYAVSFAVIGAFWRGHHRAFNLAAHYSPGVVGWNMALLAVIAFMPFVTAYFSANIGDRVPTLLYCTTLFVASLLNLKVNSTATSAPMVSEQVSRDDLLYIRRRGLTLVLGSATAVALAFVTPFIGQLGLLSIPAWRLVLAALARKRTA